MSNVTARPHSKAAAPLLWLSTLTMGLMAGFFWAFSVLVMPSLKHADDRTFIVGFQNINRGVKSGGFSFGFFGAFVFTGAAAIIHQRAGRRAPAPGIFTAFLLYIVALAVTFGGNIPLNNKLDQFGDPAKIADLAGARAAFDEDAWNSMNAVRTAATTLGLLALGAALIDHGRSTK